jgi:uncharacterized repeat protein (TIGR01451 family)
MKITFYRGDKGVTLETPVTVGLRPGYSYRVAVSNMARFPAQTFYPSLEVRGSLLPVEKMRTSDFPAGLAFSEDDFARVQAGAVVKKVIFLEKTEMAIPQASSADHPLEVQVLPNRDPLLEARDRGLPMMIVHIGQRELEEQELVQQGISGTILLPGDRSFPPPRVPPWVPWACCQMYDPVSGPAPPWPYYALPDGGDRGLSAGFDPAGRLRGLDPADTVAEYEDSRGNRRLAVSNCVKCLLPRFVVARGEMVVDSRVGLFASGKTTATQGQFTHRTSTPVLSQHQMEHLELARDRLRAGGTDNLFGTAVTGKIEGVDVQANLYGPAFVDGSKRPPTLLEPADRPLKIIKWPDKCGGVVGDVMTFFIRFSNVGGQPISNVVVSDSLVTRYEYVPGSGRADREASFTTQPNEAGSVVLRWELPGSLLPGESGMVSFQVKIR